MIYNVYLESLVAHDLNLSMEDYQWLSDIGLTMKGRQ